MTKDSTLNINFPLILDGGLSNILESYGCDLNHDLWSAKLIETDPESIIKAHYAYLDAGAKCITTSSYQASIDGFMTLGHDKEAAERLILKSIELAEIAITRFMNSYEIGMKPLIAASIGPYGAYLADGSEYHGQYDVSDSTLWQFHIDRLRLLDHSSADFFACETIPSMQEAKVLSQILAQMSKPSWISFSCKDESHINDGANIEECAALFANHPNVFAIGVNCTDPNFVSGLIRAIKSCSGSKRIVVYPNSGQVYDANSKSWSGTSDIDVFAGMAQEWIGLGADIVGGCCTIGPNHIKELSNKIIK